MKCVTAIAQGRTVPVELLGELTDSTGVLGQPEVARAHLQRDGYGLFRGVVPEDVIRAAREAVFSKLAEVDEIATPPLDGIATGRSKRREVVRDLGEFWKNVSEDPYLRRATHGAEIQAVMETLLGQPARAHDYLFLRPGRPGLSTRLHYDLPFFARGSNRILTAWLALGPIPISDGPLMVVEGSQRFMDLIEPARRVDYDSPATPTVQVMQDTVDFVRERNSKILTTDFQAGDLIVFDMLTMHGTLDNCSDQGRVRLSCDVRWQPACDPVDARYSGDDPRGTTGAGYGELNGAKPLIDAWHTR